MTIIENIPFIKPLLYCGGGLQVVLALVFFVWFLRARPEEEKSHASEEKKKMHWCDSCRHNWTEDELFFRTETDTAKQMVTIGGDHSSQQINRGTGQMEARGGQVMEEYTFYICKFYCPICDEYLFQK